MIFLKPMQFNTSAQTIWKSASSNQMIKSLILLKDGRSLFDVISTVCRMLKVCQNSKLNVKVNKKPPLQRQGQFILQLY